MKTLLAFCLLPSLLAAKLTPVAIGDLHPTQFAVGLRALVEKAAEVKAVEGDAQKLETFLKKNDFPVVLGPGGKIFLLDHHHLGLALIQRGVKKGFYSVDADWSSLSEADFWKWMVAQNKVYLRDETGQPRTPAELPASLTQLKDDPYRSLAYFVKERGGFAKSKAPFAEFQWAEYFRPRVPVGTTDGAFEAAISTAMKLARRPEASHLPGYLPPTP